MMQMPPGMMSPNPGGMPPRPPLPPSGMPLPPTTSQAGLPSGMLFPAASAAVSQVGTATKVQSVLRGFS